MSVAAFFIPRPLPTAATVVSVVLLLAACALAFRYADPVPASLALGLVLVALGIAIRVVANAMLRKNETVCREGVYAFCRHPMYVGTILAAAGVAVTLNHPIALGLPAAAAAISLWRIRKEERFLLATLPDFAAYQREVPVFPTPGSVRRALAGGRLRHPLSLKQCFLNGEMLRLNLYLGLLLAAGFYLRISPLAVAIGAALALALAVASMRLHPADAPRSRADYLLPGGLALAMLVFSLHRPLA